MIYELILIRRIGELVENERLLTDMTEEELSSLLKVKITFSKNITEIEAEIKSIIDRLVLKYGMLETLKRLSLIRKSALEVKNIKALKSMGLFLLTIKYLFKQVEKYYTVNVYLKVCSLMPKIAEEKLSDENFLRHIVKNSVLPEIALGITPDYVQESIFREESSPSLSLESVINAKNYSGQVSAEVKKTLRSCYTPSEISSYCGHMVDLLASSPLEEHKIIKNILMYEVGPNLLKSTNQTPVSIGDQCVIENFNPSYQIRPNLKESTSRFIKVYTKNWSLF